MSTLVALVGWKASPRELEIIEEHWPEGVEVVSPVSHSPEELSEVVPSVDAVVGGVSEELLRRASALRLVHVLGHGIDALLAPGVRSLLVERNVTVARANPAATNIAEFVLMAMIALNRRAFKMHEALAYQGSWSQERKAGRMTGSLGGELKGARLGLLGFGSIGKEICQRAVCFGMSVGALTRHPERIDKQEAGLDVTASVAQAEEFLRACDHVVVSLPLTDETRGFMDERRFGAMKEGSYLTNIGRGPLLVEEALYEALKSGRLAGAALDVWSCEEERGDRTYPLAFPIHHYNVLMTPHYCGATKESRERAITNAGENLRRLRDDEPLLNVARLEEGF